MMKVSIRGNRILATFFISFLIATIIPVAALSGVYSLTLQSMEEEVVSRNTSVLNQCRQAADGIFSLTENIISSLSFDRAAYRFVSRAYPYTSAELASCISDLGKSVSIQRYVMEQADIIELGVYSSRSQAIVSSRAKYARADNYFSASLKISDENMLREIKNASTFMFHPMTQIQLFGQDYDVVVATSPIFSANSRLISGASAYAILDASRLSTTLGDMLLSDSCFAFIADSDGNILIQASGSAAKRYSTVNDIDVNADGYIVLSTSDEHGRVYTAYISSDVIYEKVSYIRNIMFIVTMLGLAVGILASFVLALRSSRPVMDIYDIVRGGDQSPAVGAISYDYLKGRISDFISNNAVLNARMQQYMDYSRRDFIRRLADGSTFLPDEIDSRARALGIDLTAKLYAAIMVRRPAAAYKPESAAADIDDISNMWMLVEKAFADSTAFSALLSGDNESDMSIIILMATDDESKAARLLLDETSRIDGELRAQFNLSLEYVCGGFARDIAGMGPLFARIHDAPATGDGVLRFANHSVNEQVYYSLHEEMQLIKAISAGADDIANGMADKLIERNLGDACVSPERLRTFRCALYITISRAAEDMLFRDEIMRRAAFLTDEKANVSAKGLPGRIHDLIDGIIALNRLSNESRDKEQLSRILDFIRDHISEPEFTLYNVSEEFGLTESYLYKYIRTNSGLTFAALLEKYRMQRASELLATGEYTVDDVARLCGYNSSHAFRRVFKRTFDILPTQYRAAMSTDDAHKSE